MCFKIPQFLFSDLPAKDSQPEQRRVSLNEWRIKVPIFKFGQNCQQIEPISLILIIKMDIEGRSRSREAGGRFEKPDRDSRLGDIPPSNKLYLTFLPEDIDEDTLRDIFQEIGTVSRIKIIKKDDGFTLAFIDMGDLCEAEKAIHKLNRYKIGEKSIRVQFAREKRQDGGGDRDNSREKGGFRGDFKRESDTRKRFEGNEERGRGRGRGGDRDGGRGGFRNDDMNEDRGRGGFRDGGERKPVKCFKCQGEGHISKNCPAGDNEVPSRNDNDRSGRYDDRNQRGDRNEHSDRNDRVKPKQPEKMSEDEFDDY